MNELENVKLFIDENMFQLTDILVSATDGHSKNITSQDYWMGDIGVVDEGLYNILNFSLYNMGTADTSMLMELNPEVDHEIVIFDPNYFYFTRIEVHTYVGHDIIDEVTNLGSLPCDSYSCEVWIALKVLHRSHRA